MDVNNNVRPRGDGRNHTIKTTVTLDQLLLFHAGSRIGQYYIEYHRPSTAVL